MSPAGYWPQRHAAIEAGADSVYFGLRHFSARAKAGFSPAELPEAVRLLHQRGVKGFITFNTLIFQDELKEAARLLEQIADSGADALIVQDLAALKLARAIAPGLELHASTQMSITDARGVAFAQSLGAARVTLARELSLAEIGAIRRESDCELEIFVHGALCVAYSGQCFSSEAWGGRSANRGQCAQACRLPYELLVDGAIQLLGDARYLLSPEDLCTIDQVPQLVELGIAALKIEGRYKDADYVALTTRAYRQAVDGVALSSQEKLHLEQVYSRGLGAHFLSGTNHQSVVRGRAPRHRGVLMGRVEQVFPNTVEISTTAAHGISPLKPGDGLVFDAADWRSPQEAEEGGRLYDVRPSARAGVFTLGFANDAVDFRRIRAGDLVWRTHSPELDRLVKPFVEAPAPVSRQPVDVDVEARAGERLHVEWRAGSATVVTESDVPLTTAQGGGVSEPMLREQLGRLGGTAYCLNELRVLIADKPFVPAALLNQLRRRAVTLLQQEQGMVRRRRERNATDALALSIRSDVINKRSQGVPRLHLLVRNAEQLDAAMTRRPASITLDYLDLYGLKPSVEQVRQSGIAVRVASPRILKPGEERIVDFLLRLETPLLVRSSGLLTLLTEGGVRRELIGDFSLNAANSISATELLARGLTRLAPAHDLNAAQINALARDVGGAFLEAIAYQHLPVFHTEHCVFCRFLSTGTTFRDCGRPCEKHTVSVRDQNGRAHPVVADIGCRNTVFGAEAQEASLHLADWRATGIGDFRLEFAHETGAGVEAVTRLFERALNDEIGGLQLSQELKRIAPQGTTLGSLFVPLSTLTSNTREY